MKTLIVIDMQNDFVTGCLGTPAAVAILPKVKEKIQQYLSRGDRVIFTRDTHFDDYLETQEGRLLPVEHCIKGTHGWEIVDGLAQGQCQFVNKKVFGYTCWDIYDLDNGDEIELIGVCTDICVVSNALIIKSIYPELTVSVDSSCCAGTTPANHEAALRVMRCCHVEVK